MKKNYNCLTLLLLLLTLGVQAQSGIYENYLIVNSGTYYDLLPPTPAPGNDDFQGWDFGTFAPTQTFTLEGFQNKTYKCDTDDVQNGSLYYRVYLSTDPAPAFIGPITTTTVIFDEDDPFCIIGTDRRQTWEDSSLTTNIVAGLADGLYYFEVYTTADFTFTSGGGGSGTHRDPVPPGSYYRATFMMCDDTVPPTITCPADVTVSTDGGTCVATGVALGSPTTADNCPGETATNDAPATFPIGNTTVTWTVTDADLNTATCTQTVTVEDNENPTISCPADVTVSTDGGTCDATGVALGSPTTTDNCPGETAANDAPATFPIGNTTVTWTVTDAAGNTATCTQTVTVEDNENPTISCPADVTVSTDGGTCDATGVALGSPTTTDNCPGETAANNAPATFPIGNTTVTWTVTDAAGNTATCTQTVTVEDNENPTISCPADVTVSTDGGTCDATGVALGSPTTSDNCPGETAANNAPATFPIGNTTVTWTVTDAAGNTATCTQTVTVEDNENPTISCPADVTVSTDGGTCDATGVALGSPTTTDNCPGETAANDAPATFPIGNTTVTWTVTDAAGNTATCTQTVTVEDNENPTISCPADVTVSTDGGTCDATGVALGSPTTSDNCPGETAANNAPATFPIGNTTVTWTVTDAAGNTATCTQTVTVEDNENPTISCPADVTVSTDGGTCDATGVALGSPTTTDNCPGETAANDAPATFPIGNTTVTWTVTDAAGNTATCTQTVTVEDNENPTISCPADITVSNDAGNCSAVVTYTVPFADNCAGETISQTAGLASGVAFPVGTTTNTFVVTDAAGNSATCSFDVTVNDTEDPTLTCPADITTSNDPGNCSAVVTYTVPFADNCAGETISQTAGLASGAAFPVGTTTNTFVVTDAAGNSATCSFDVTVNDTEDPTISCPADITVSNDAGNCSAVVTYNVPFADNCAGETISQTAGLASGVAFPVGTTTNTFVVTDAAGNSATCSFDVTVNDTEDPTLTCPADITVSNDAGNCSAVVTYTVPFADNCAGETISQTAGLASGVAFPVGTTTNTFVVTDAAGNSATCSFDVTVNDTEDPTLTCPADITTSNDPGNCSAVVTYTVPFADNCAGETISQTAGLASGAAFPVGTTTNTFVVTDAAGNSATCSFDVTVNDTEDPTISCPADITTSNDAGNCSAVVTYTVPFADNCAGETISQTAGLASGAAFPVGTTTNTFVVTDAAGNSATCSFDVTVNDTEDPTLTCPADITTSNDPGNCSAVVTYTVPFADNCAGETISQTAGLASGAAFPVGTTTNTFVVTDAAGNSATCSFDVTVNDTEDPTLTCPADITVSNDAGNCSAVVTYTVPFADNCAGETISQTAGLASGVAFPVGTTTNTFVVTDAAGNSATCSFDVTVNDTEDPTLTCPADITTSNDAGNCSAVVTYTVPFADNCAGETISQTAGLASGVAFPVGTTTNTFVVTDAAGNSATCSFDVTVNDTEDPTLTCPADITTSNDAGNCSAVVTYTVPFADNCAGETISQTAGLASGAAFPVGTTTNTFVVTDAAGNSATCSFDVTVNDTEDPTISCPADITVSNDAGNCSAVVTYTVPFADNCAGETISQTAGLASGVAFPVGTTTNTFVVTDAAGNSATCSFDVTVNDTEDPTLTCPADITVSNDAGNCSAVVTYTVPFADNCAGETISQTAGLASGAAFPVGTTTNTFVVTDAAGNSATCSFDVTVNDTEDPTLTCPADITTSNDPGNCSAVVTYNVPFADNCAGETISQTAGLASGVAFPVGTTTNTFVVTDAAGNSATCSFDVTVNDTEDPTLTCPADITTSNDPGNCSAVVTYTVPFADNCAGETISQTAGLASGAAFPVGTTTNTFVVTDAAGNSATCSFDVTVNDTEDPTLTCPADITTSNDPGNCSAVVTYTVPFADNCAGETISQTAGLASGVAFPVGTTTNTFVVTDAAGNSATCSFDVTVNDTEDPTLTCPADITTSNDPGNCSAVVTYNVPFADNCAGETISQTAGLASGAAFPVGTTTNTFVVTDAAGNSATCSFDVTVNDTEDPTLTCPADITTSNDPGNCSAVVTYNVPFADNCAGETISQTAGLASGVAFPVGTTTNTFVVTDAAGNSATCSFDVTVNDTEDPTLTCPADITTSNDAGNCSAVVTYTVPFADNCAGETISQTAGLASGVAFPVGTTTNTFVVTDAAGNSATCSFDVTVNDTEDPTLTCPADITTSNDPGNCSAVVTYTVPFADNCAGETISQTAGLASGAAFPVGTTTNTFVVTDAAGNSATCSFDVTVNDTEDPTLTCPADITTSNDPGNCSAVVTYNVPFADNCAGETISQTAGLASGAAFPVGTTTNTFVVTDAAGNSATCSFDVTVNDTEDPTLTCPADITTSNDPGNCSAVVTYNVPFADNCAGETISQTAGLASGVAFPVGTTTNTFVVTDAAGNSATCSFDVTVNDTEDPTISCPTDITVGNDIDSCTAVVNYAVTSTDNCAGETITQTAGLPSGSAFPQGTTTNTFVVTDAAGNTATCSFDVTVNDTTAPNAVCMDMTVQLQNGIFNISELDIDNGSSDNCGNVSLSISPSSFDCSNIGPNNVTLTVTDDSGNSSTCIAIVTVEDITPPDASCGSISLTLDPITGQATITDVNALYTGSGDLCGGYTLSLAQTVFGCNDLGTNLVELTITDDYGNSSTCDVSVTIDAPIITSGTLTGIIVDPIPDNPQPADDLIEVTECPGGTDNPTDIQLTLNLDGSSTIVASNVSTWQISTDNGATWTDIPGTSGLLQYTILDIHDTHLVRVVILSGTCVEYSPLAVIRFLPPDVPPTIVSVSNTDICLGDTVTIVAESYFETPGGGQWGDGGLFNQAQPDGWRVDGIDGFFPASGNNQSEPTWKETNGPTIQSGIRYDTSDNTKFAVAHGPNNTTLETPIFNTVGMTAAEAILEFHQAYYFCNGGYGVIELSIDGGNSYGIVLNTQEGDNLTSPNNSGVQVNGKDGTNCGNGPNGQKPTSDPFQFSSLDLSSYIGMANLRVRFSFFGNMTECEDTYFPPHPGNTCGNIPDEFDVYSGWVIDDVGFPYAYVDEELEWTDEDGVVVATGTTVNVTPVTPGVREYGVTSLINGCRADGDDGTEFITINTSLAYAGQDFVPQAGDCGQSTIDLRAYDNALTAVQNFTNGAWETGLYVVPDVGAGDTDFVGTGMTGIWTVVAATTTGCGASETFSSETNPYATFTAEPGDYTLRWTLANGCFDEVDITINNCSTVDFDGVDDFVNFKNNYGLGNAFSLEAWIKSNNTSGIRTIISKRNETTSTSGYDFSVENGILKFNWYSASGNGSISSNYAINTSRWYHTAVTFDGTTYTLYLDGISVGTATGTINAPDATNGSVECLLGAIDQANGSNNIVTNHFSGWMDEVKVWNTALSAAQIRQMMNQEIDDNGAVHGVIVPLDIPGLNWVDLDGYYRMDANCGYLAAYKGVNGRLRNITTFQQETAPIPYTSRVDGQLWSTDNTWTEFNVWDPPHSNGVDGITPITWNIAQISHNIDSGDKDIIVLGLISDTPNKELTISDPVITIPVEDNDGQSLRITHYLKLDGDIDLVGKSQLLQDQNSVLDVTSAGKLERDQQGTTNLFNYNYWSSPVNPVNITANNTDYSVDAVLRDGSDSNNPLNLLWTSGYDADGSTTPITMSSRWIYSYENFPNDVDPLLTYAEWVYLQESGTLSVGLGYTMKGSGNGDPVLDVQNYVFVGKPNNGTITTPITAGNQALVGNPYASALDADEFIRDNIPGPGGNVGSSSSIDGTIYLWEHFTTNFTHYLEDYEGAYATYNLTGGLGAYGPPLISGNGTSTKTPGRYVPIGQGFFITALSSPGGNVSFHNDQRVYVKEAVGASVFMEANNNDMNFTDTSNYSGVPNTYSYASSEDEGDVIKRVRINCTTPEGSIRPLLLGFVPNGDATDGIDYGYDSENTDNFPNDFSWVIEGGFYTTQGVGDFDVTKQYPIGVRITDPGDIEIAFNGIENFEEPIEVYIHDALYGTYTLLNENIFHLNIEAGTYMDRFYIAFENGDNLGTTESIIDGILVNYLNDTDEIYIHMPNVNSINQISIVNIIGQNVKSFDPEDFRFMSSNELRIPITNISEGTYIIKVETDRGTTNKKVIINY